MMIEPLIDTFLHDYTSFHKEVEEVVLVLVMTFIVILSVFARLLVVIYSDGHVHGPSGSFVLIGHYHLSE